MEQDFGSIWETYVAAWKASTEAEKRRLFEQSLDPACLYTDPLTQTRGWEALIEYMFQFHQQFPGAYFTTRLFFTHSHKSTAKWDMCDPSGMVLGEGMSYAEYNPQGKLIAMTGFFTPPGA